MKRVTHVLGLFLFVMVSVPRSADADIWDWLQEFSGPGPFHTRSGNLTFKTCPGTWEGHRLADVPYKPLDPDANPSCFFFDVRTFENKDDDNFKVKVRADIFEAGLERRLHPSIALGFGAGFIRFGAPGISTTRLVLTVPRVELTPFLLLRSNEYWLSHPKRRKAASLLKYYGRENIVIGNLTGADFGAPGMTFDVLNDRVASTGFIIDVSELFRTWTR